MSEATIREARPHELELVRSTYLAWGYNGGAGPADTILLAEQSAQLVGIVRRTEEFGVVMLRGMQVAAEARRKGIGTQLLEEFVKRLAGRECYCIPYAHLINFYGSQGFEIESPETAPSFLSERLADYRARRLDVVIMRRPSA